MLGWCPDSGPGSVPTYEVINWRNLTWWWRVNIKMLSSLDDNDKVRTWAQELGPYTLAATADQFNSDGLAAARGPPRL